jgi:hypothetical protein
MKKNNTHTRSLIHQKIQGGLVNVGNHMSVVRLTTGPKRGKFLCLGALDPNAPCVGQTKNCELKEELDRLTRGGRLIEAVVSSRRIAYYHSFFFFSSEEEDD